MPIDEWIEPDVRRAIRDIKVLALGLILGAFIGVMFTIWFSGAYPEPPAEQPKVTIPRG